MTLEEQIEETYQLALNAKAEREKATQFPRAIATVLDKKKWPWLVRSIALFRANTDKGVGDTLAREIKRFRFNSLAEAYQYLTGKSCGCTDRQAKLNTLYPYA